jgi:hypothetical protein
MARTVKAKPWRTPVRKKLERDVEKACKQWARDHGWWVRKFKAPGNRSVPDDLFAKAWPNSSRKIAVEFKKLGKTSTEKQLEEQAAMREAGWEVYEIDSFEKFKALFESIEAEEAKQNEPLGWLEFN